MQWGRKAGLILLAVMVLIFFCSCHGSGSSPRKSFTGTWDVRYNIIVDDCGLLSSSIPGFTDQHYIEQEGDLVDFNSLTELVVTEDGTIREDGSLIAVRNVLQPNGCEYAAIVEYEDLIGDTATTLFSLQLACPGDFFCESNGIGQAVRQKA